MFDLGCLLTNSISLIFVAGSERYFVLCRKSVKVISMYSVLTSREPESYQVAFFDPSQDSHLAYPAVPGNNTGGEKLRVHVF
jgi:hypothetical protein